jgi:hypothetical protein
MAAFHGANEMRIVNWLGGLRAANPFCRPVDVLSIEAIFLSCFSANAALKTIYINRTTKTNIFHYPDIHLTNTHLPSSSH